MQSVLVCHAARGRRPTNPLMMCPLQHFASERVRLAQLTNKCKDPENLDFYIRQAAEVLGVTIDGRHSAEIETTAAAIREKMDVYGIVIHPRKSAAAALRTADGVQTGRYVGPFTSSPKLSTGAGDNFNAGFCLGQLAGLGVTESVCCGTHTSGFYVRNAHSPSLTELADFLDDPPPAED